jgi:hypothetical protein
MRGEAMLVTGSDLDELLVFGGSGSPRLTAAICESLGVEPGRGEAIRFSDGNLFVKVNQNVRGRHVHLVQSTVFPANDNFMELLFWIDAFKRASAASVTVLMPYFSYAKADKKDEPRVSIRARVCAQSIEAAGADRVVTMDLHAPQIQGFFTRPHAGGGGRVPRGARCAERARGRDARGVQRKVDGTPRLKPDLAALRHRHRGEPARTAVAEGAEGLGRAAVRRGDRPHPPPREHQRPVRVLTSNVPSPVTLCTDLFRTVSEQRFTKGKWTVGGAVAPAGRHSRLRGGGVPRAPCTIGSSGRDCPALTV